MIPSGDPQPPRSTRPDPVCRSGALPTACHGSRLAARPPGSRRQEPRPLTRRRQTIVPPRARPARPPRRRVGRTPTAAPGRHGVIEGAQRPGSHDPATVPRPPTTRGDSVTVPRTRACRRAGSEDRSKRAKTSPVTTARSTARGVVTPSPPLICLFPIKSRWSRTRRSPQRTRARYARPRVLPPRISAELNAGVGDLQHPEKAVGSRPAGSTVMLVPRAELAP